MEAVVVGGPGDIRIERREMPRIGPDEVLIEVAAAGLCGTDLQICSGQYMAQYPVVPGHEFSGTVAEVGAGVQEFRAGDRVVADPNIACNRCYFCQRNEQNHCENWQGVGITRDGAFARYVALPAGSVFRIQGLSFDEAAMVEPLACVVYGLERAGIPFGADVLIYGAGPIGLLHLQMLRAGGAARVVVTDIDAARLELAERFGGIPVPAGTGARAEQERALTRLAPRGFDLVIDATGVAPVIEAGLRRVKRGGKLLVFGVTAPEDTIRVHPYELFHKDLTVLGSFAVRKTFPEAIGLLEHGVVQIGDLVSERLPLQDFPGTIERFKKGETAMKVLFHPG